MIFQIIIQQPHLLEQFENNLRNVIIFLDNVQCFIELFIQILSLSSFVFKNIEGYFTHFDSIQFSWPRIWCLSYKTIFISCIVFLVSNDIILELIEFRIQIVKINTCYINFIHILFNRIAWSYSDIPSLFQTTISFR